eukprot:403339780
MLRLKQYTNPQGNHSMSSQNDPTKAYFDTLLKLQKAEPYLSQRLVTIFEQSFDLNLVLDPENQLGNESPVRKDGHHQTLSNNQLRMQSDDFFQLNKVSVGLDQLGQNLEQVKSSQAQSMNSNNIASRNIHEQLINNDDSILISQVGVTGFYNNFQSTPQPSMLENSNIAINAQSSNSIFRQTSFQPILMPTSTDKKSKNKNITPQNMKLILNLLDYLENTKNVADQCLLDLLLTLVIIIPKMQFLGFPDNISAKSGFEIKFYSSLERILSNKHLPIRFNAQLSEYISTQSNLFEEVMEILNADETKRSKSKYNALLSKLSLTKLFNQRQQEHIIQTLKSKYQNNLKEGLKKDQNRKFIVILIRNMLSGSNTIIHSLFQSNQVAEIQSMCVKQVNKILHKNNNKQAISQQLQSNGNAQSSPKKLITFDKVQPYFGLLISLLAHRQNTESHLLTEFLIYFFKNALDRPQQNVLINSQNVQVVVSMLLKTLQDNGAIQKDKELVYEIIEGLNIFNTVFQKQNQSLYDYVTSAAHSQRSVLSDQSTSLSAHYSQNQSQNIPSALDQLNSNIEILGLKSVFEDSILAIVYSMNETLKQQVQLVIHKLVKNFEVVEHQLTQTELQILIKQLLVISLQDIQREELSTFVISELGKLFKRPQLSYLMPSIINLIAETCDLDNKSSSAVLQQIIDIFNQHWNEQQLEGIDQTGFFFIIRSINRIVIKIESHKKSSQSSTDSQRMYQQFISLWLTIIGYLTKQHIEREVLLFELMQLAQFTPYLAYQSEFSLIIRLGMNKELIESFIQYMFQQFPTLNQMPQVPLQPQIKRKAQKQALQAAVEIQDDDEDNEEEQEDLNMGDKLFLALFAFIQELRINAISHREIQKSDCSQLKLIESGNFIESLLMIYVNDKLDSDLFMFKLEKLTYSLFELYMTYLKRLAFDQRKDSTVVADFTFLLKSSCHLQERLRSKARSYLQNYIESFPYLLNDVKIFTTFMDLLTALNAESYAIYDSLSYPLRLICSAEQILLPTEAEKKTQILADLQNLFVDMVIYGFIFSEDKLNLNLEHYKFTFNSEVKKVNIKEYQENQGNLNYSILLFEHLRSTLDFSKVENHNFYVLRKQAITKPWQFIKTIDEIKRQAYGLLSAQNGPGIQGLQSGIFNVQKKQHSSQIDKILSLKPFQGTEQKIQKSNLSQNLEQYQTEIQNKLKNAMLLISQQQAEVSGGISSTSNYKSHKIDFNAYHHVYKDLELKLLKIMMKLDIYYQVQNLLKYHTKDVVLQIIKKQNDYLNKIVSKQKERLVEQQKNTNGFNNSSAKFSIMPQLTMLESNLYSGNLMKLSKSDSSGINKGILSNQRISDAQYLNHLPLILKDNQKVNQNVQKLVHQGLITSLLTLNHNPQSKNQYSSKNEISMIQNQIIALIHQIPAQTMCKETIKAYHNCVYNIIQLSNNSKVVGFLLLNQSFGITQSIQKIQNNSTMYQAQNSIKQFTIKNQMKANIKEIAKTYTSVDYLESLVSKYGYIQAVISNQTTTDDQFLKLKLQSGFTQENTTRHVLKYLNLYVDLLTENLALMITKSTENLGKLAQFISQIIGDQGEQKWFRKSSGEKCYIKTGLKIAKLGLLVCDFAKSKQQQMQNSSGGSGLSIGVDKDFHSRVYRFMIDFLRVTYSKAIQNTIQDQKEEIQLIEDIKFLLDQDQIALPHQQQEQALKDTLALETDDKQQRLIMEILTSVSYKRQFNNNLIRHNLIPVSCQKTQTRSIKNNLCIIHIENQKQLQDYQQVLKNQVAEHKLYNSMASHLLMQLKYTLLGWNYNEKMLNLKLQPSIDIAFLQEKAYSLVKQMPKLMTQIYFSVGGINQRMQDFIRPHLQDDMIKRPMLYLWSNDALQIYLEYHLANKKLKECKSKAALWRCWDIIKQLKYIGFKYNSEYFLNQMGLKPLEYVDSKIILLYLSEIFQSLRNDCQQQIQKFLIKKSKEYASVAHNVLWFCKVESQLDKNKGRKVALPLRENLPEVAELLDRNVSKTMTNIQKEFFEIETEFFERVTSISGLLNPKQSKDEKKAIIREKLVEYNKSIPESVYLPTNSNCRVVGIIPSSGAPMQSAARVPILVSFEVEDYPGPDNDPFLNQESDFSNQSTQYSERQQISGKRLQEQSYLINNQLKKKSTLLMNKKKTINIETKRSVLMKHESVILDDNQASQYKEEIYDNESDDNPSDEDDPNTSPKNSASVEGPGHPSGVRNKLQMYNFIPNKNQDKFNSVSISVQNSAQTINSVVDRDQVLKGSSLINPGLKQLQLRSQRQSDQSLSQFKRFDEEEKLKEQSISDDSSSKAMQQNLTFRNPQLNHQNLSWNEAQNQLGVSYYASQANQASPESRMMISKRYSYVPMVDVNQLASKKSGINFIMNYEQKLKSGGQYVKRKISINHKSPQNQRTQVKQMVEFNNQKNVKVVSCIFKVNDDLRQDILALQIIKLFQKIFKQHDLDLFVSPYKCISNRTGEDKTLGGMMECVPFTNSRDQLGKAFEIDLYQYFLKRYGSESSTEFKVARLNFIKSLSAYSVVSYILQIKDRHNGNILMDDFGHIIHIDFGFIFDWSPGKDMGFESAGFKMTKEFIDILGGNQKAEAYQLFVTKTIQAYLAVREHAREFKTLVTLMIYSGFPCFKEHSLQKLEERFRLDLNTLEAANHMRAIIQHAHDKWSTNFYDKIQYLQNKIVF